MVAPEQVVVYGRAVVIPSVVGPEACHVSGFAARLWGDGQAEPKLVPGVESALAVVPGFGVFDAGNRLVFLARGRVWTKAWPANIWSSASCSAGSTGLTRTASNPDWSACCRVSASAWPVTATSAVVASSGLSRRRRATSNPLRPGKPKSRRTTSGRWRTASSSAASLAYATRGSYPQ